MSDLASELLHALELAVELVVHMDSDARRALEAQLDRVEQAMADAVDEALGPDDGEPLEAVA